MFTCWKWRLDLILELWTLFIDTGNCQLYLFTMDYIYTTFNSAPGITYPSDWVQTVAYNPSLLYSTLIIAILLTKGYGRNIAMAIGRKILHEPSKKIWKAVRAIKPRQIMYYGLRWGIPIHQLKDLLMLHRNLLRKRPGRASNRHRCSHKSKKQTLKARSLNSTVSMKQSSVYYKSDFFPGLLIVTVIY